MSANKLDAQNKMSPEANKNTLSRIPQPASLLPIILLFISCALGAFLRFYYLAEIPPAFTFDEAAHALDALDILQGKFMLASGRLAQTPAGYMYLLALAFKLFGAVPLVQRSLTALLGVLMIPATYLAARELFYQEGAERASFTAALSGLLVASIFWPVLSSRIGFEYIVPPLVFQAAIYLFYRGCRTSRAALLVPASLCAAGCFYFFSGGAPFVLVIPVTALLLWFLRRFKTSAPATEGKPCTGGQVRLFAAMSFIWFAPLFISFISGPSPAVNYSSKQFIFFREPGFPAGLRLLGENIITYLAAFLSWGGTSDWLQTIPGRPILSPVFAACFAAGLLICVWRMKRFPYMLLLVEWGGLLLPALLTTHDDVALFRSAGAIPATCIMMALALMEATFFLQRRLPKPNFWLAAAPALLLSLVWLPAETFHDYFQIWAPRPEVAEKHDDAAQALITRMQQESDPTAVFLLIRKADKQRPNYILDFLYHGQAPLRYISIEPRTLAQTLTAELHGRQIIHVITELEAGREDDQKDADPSGLLPRLLLEHGVRQGKENTPDYTIVTYRLDDPNTDFAAYLKTTLPEGYTPLAFPINDELTLIGEKYRLEGHVFSLELAWRREAAAPRDYTVFVQLLDQQGNRLAGVDIKPDYSFSWLGRGQILLTDYSLDLSTAAKTSRCAILVGIYYFADGQPQVVWSQQLLDGLDME